MKKNETASSSEQSPKHRRSKSREVNSRFLSPASSQPRISSPNQKTLSSPPIRRKSTTTNDVLDKPRGIFPSSSSSSSSSSSIYHSSNKKLADHLGNMERKTEEKRSWSNKFFSRQKSYSEFSRFGSKEKDNLKENHRPIIGGSMRYTPNFRFSDKTSTISSKSSIPGRLSSPSSELLSDLLGLESEGSSETFSNSTDFSSPSIGKINSNSTSKVGIEVSSRYLNDSFSKLGRVSSSDSNIQTPMAMSDNSSNSNNSIRKNVMKRGNSLKTSQWGLSPGRSSFSSSGLKPPNSHSKSKGVGSFFSLGLEMFKGKKSSASSTLTSSPLGRGISDNAHQLRLLYNRLIQWRYINARTVALNANKITHAESSLFEVWTSLSELQSSVVRKRIQYEKEKLEFKLNSILHSEVKPLEDWGDMERQHILAVSMIKDCLHSVVCKVPLVEGAKVNPQLASVELRHSIDLTTSIETMLSNLFPTAEKTGSLLSELAEVVSREKLLLEECSEYVGLVSALEIQERSLKCNIVQLKSQLQRLNMQQQLEGKEEASGE